jgi:phospholipid N-methyltransferase
MRNMSRASSHGDTVGRSVSRTDFVRSFFRDYKTVGAVRETSRGVAQCICELARVHDARGIAEFGCGTGPITRVILEQMPDDGILWGYEVHEPFIQHLRTSITDPRFTLFEQSAAKITEHRHDQDMPPFDAIISTIPFSYLTRQQTREILDAVVDSMTDDGTFVALQYHPTYLPPSLRQHFDSVNREIYLLNLPPAHLFTARMPRRL